MFWASLLVIGWVVTASVFFLLMVAAGRSDQRIDELIRDVPDFDSEDPEFQMAMSEFQLPSAMKLDGWEAA